MVKCELCKIKEYEEIHHRDRNHTNNNKDNLLYLCKLCHYKAHGKTQRKDSKRRIEKVKQLTNLLRFNSKGQYLGKA